MGRYFYWSVTLRCTFDDSFLYFCCKVFNNLTELNRVVLLPYLDPHRRSASSGVLRTGRRAPLPGSEGSARSWTSPAHRPAVTPEERGPPSARSPTTVYHFLLSLCVTFKQLFHIKKINIKFRYFTGMLTCLKASKHLILEQFDFLLSTQISKSQTVLKKKKPLSLKQVEIPQIKAGGLEQLK